MSKIISLGSKKYPGYKCIVDDEDYNLLVQYRWSPFVNPKKNTIYAQTNMNNKHVYIHRFIMNFNGFDINNRMIDHDGMNNQKYNLRVCSNADNLHNSVKPKHGIISKYKGVTFNKHAKKFQSQIHLDYSTIYIGLYISEEEAALAYNKKAIELFGEYALLNIVEENLN
jgi:hypothetical protein